MHSSQDYINNHYLQAPVPVATALIRPLSGSEAAALFSNLKNDSVGYLFSALVSLGDAISAIHNSFWSWSTVKLYYAVFYSMRCYLALDGHCIFYIGSKPMTLHAQAGKIPSKLDGPTHKVVLSLFEAIHSHHFLLSQEIDLISPIKWLMSKREEANYKNPRFWEPQTPSHFQKIHKVGVRSSIKAYCGTDNSLYLFDSDHAILAYPVNVIRETINLMRSKPNIGISPEDVKYVKSLFKDRTGPIPELYDLL